MIAVSGAEVLSGAGAGASPPPKKNIFFGFLFGVVFRVFLLFGGVFRVLLMLFCYCSATE